MQTVEFRRGTVEKAWRNWGCRCDDVRLPSRMGQKLAAFPKMTAELRSSPIARGSLVKWVIQFIVARSLEPMAVLTHRITLDHDTKSAAPQTECLLASTLPSSDYRR